MRKPDDIDGYIAGFPDNVQKPLRLLRQTIRQAAPDAVEVISYGMPGFKLNGMLVWFGAFSNHVGFYPRASGIERYKDELTDYKWAKGSVQFPFDRDLPVELIAKIVKYRVNENRLGKTTNR